MTRRLWTRIATHTASACVGAVFAAGVLLSTGYISNRDKDNDNIVDKQRPETSSMTPTTTPKGRHNLQGLSPTLPIYIFNPNPHLEIAFDTRTRNPVYVLERLSAQQKQLPNKDSNSNNKESPRKRFVEETSLSPEFRSRNGHYRKSGYDRGHLAPAADFSSNSSERGDTYSLCNASPQVPSMNRTVWAQLESLVRKIAQQAEEEDDTCAVVTGPLWLPSRRTADQTYQYCHDAIGAPPSLVSVPTHFFKAVVVVNPKDGAINKFAAFVVPNADIPRTKNLQQYLVRWSDLEAVAGMHLFPGLIKGQGWKDYADILTQDAWEKSAHEKGEGPLLLEQSGSTEPKNTRKQGQTKRLLQNTIVLEHLCANGQCRR